MRTLTSNEGELLSQFDKIDDSQAEIGNFSLILLLINNHDVTVKKRKIKGQLPLQQFCGFCRAFKKITKQLGFHLIFKTSDLQDVFIHH